VTQALGSVARRIADTVCFLLFIAVSVCSFR